MIVEHEAESVSLPKQDRNRQLAKLDLAGWISTSIASGECRSLMICGYTLDSARIAARRSPPVYETPHRCIEVRLVRWCLCTCLQLLFKCMSSICHPMHKVVHRARYSPWIIVNPLQKLTKCRMKPAALYFYTFRSRFLSVLIQLIEDRQENCIGRIGDWFKVVPPWLWLPEYASANESSFTSSNPKA